MDVKIIDYSEKAILVNGDTKLIKTGLKEIGGKWNPALKGWIFPKTKTENVKKLIDEYTSGQRKVEREETPAEMKFVPYAVFSSLLKRVEKLEAILSQRQEIVDVPNEDEDEEEKKPMKRLLHK